MILSTLTFGLTKHFGDEGAVRAIAEAGFDAVDYSFFGFREGENPFCREDFKEYFSNLKKVAEESGVFFNQAHAPFPAYKFGDDAYNDEVSVLLKKSMEASGILGIKNIIIHPVACPKGVDQFAFNIQLYNKLLEYAKAYGVKIALENMFGFDDKRGCLVENVCSNAEELARYRDALDKDWFTVCVDIGHCGLVGNDAAEMIRDLGSRIGALHIHDNGYKIDDHTLPYMGKLNWDEILKALADIEYQGDFTYEAFNFLYGFDKEFIPTALKFMHDTGRYMIDKIDSYK